MKTHIGLFFLAATLATLSVTGCDKTSNTAGTQSSATTEPHAGSTRVNDLDVTEKVKAALAQDEILKGFGITVETRKGDVKLTGLVDNQSQIDHAKQLVLGIEGAHTVHNELSIKK